MSRVVRLVVVALFAVVLPTTSALAQAPGYVRIKLVKAGLMVRAGGGSGVLTYRGRDYPFRVSGLSLGVTAGGICQPAERMGLRHMPGKRLCRYLQFRRRRGAFVGGFGGVQLGNEKGVKLALQGPRAGMEFAANLSEVRISLK